MINKSKKSILFLNFIAMIICCCMLLGTTYAWLTDSVGTQNNIIAAGNLNVSLQYKTVWSDKWDQVDENTKLFKEGVVYEPGYTEVVYLKVSNVGTLAFKYILSLNIANEEHSINVYDEQFRISDYLHIGTYVQDEYSSGFNYADILMPTMFGNRQNALKNVSLQTLSNTNVKIVENAPILPGKETSQIIVIVLTVPETIGNEVNTKPGVEIPYIELGVSLFATQYAHENDSFGNQYDENVEQPNIHEIYNNDDLDKAFAEGGQGIIKNMHMTDVKEVLAEDKSLALNMYNSTLNGTADNFVIVNKGNLSLTGDGTIVTNMQGSIENYGILYVNNLNIVVKGSKYGFHCRAGEVEINDIVLNAERGGLNIQGGKVTVNSGSITTTSYGTNTGYLVYAASYDSCSVVINGGTFKYVPGYYKHGVLYAGQNASIVVNGGKFSKGGSNTKIKWITEANGGTVTIYGGTFEFDPSDFVADGYKANLGADGWWTVAPIE